MLSLLLDSSLGLIGNWLLSISGLRLYDGRPGNTTPDTYRHVHSDVTLNSSQKGIVSRVGTTVIAFFLLLILRTVVVDPWQDVAGHLTGLCTGGQSQ